MQGRRGAQRRGVHLDPCGRGGAAALNVLAQRSTLDAHARLSDGAARFGMGLERTEREPSGMPKRVEMAPFHCRALALRPGR